MTPKEKAKQIKCYCGHTTYCDCGPLEEPQKETLEEALNQNKMKIDQEDFNKKAGHIIETVVKPQVKRYEKKMLKEKTIAIIGMFIVTTVIIVVMTLIAAWAFNRTY